MAEPALAGLIADSWELEATGPATLAEVMEEEELRERLVDEKVLLA